MRFKSAFSLLVFFVFTAVLTLQAAAGADAPWADSYLDYSPVDPVNDGFDTPENIVGEPRGGGPYSPDNTSLVSLGVQGGSITVRFNTPVKDDPDNPMGLDCIVYGNSQWSGSSGTVRWQEPAMIEISRDVNGNGLPDDPWYLIPGSLDLRYTPPPWRREPAGDNNSADIYGIMAGTIQNPNVTDGDPATNDQEYYWGYAELSPTMPKYLDNYVRPDDPFTVGITPRSGGGDAFDIAWAVDADGNRANLTEFDFLRLTNFIDRTFEGFGYATPEICAVADVAPDIDLDHNTILDDYERRVARTDPTRTESTLLPLEIPAYMGQSSPGDLLGTAIYPRGTALRFYAAQDRTAEGRRVNCAVDIQRHDTIGGTLPNGMVASGVIREILSVEPDFVAAGIEAAEVIIRYTSTDIAALDEDTLTVYRLDDGAYNQDGLSAISINTASNLVSFRTQYAGRFVLAAQEGSGDDGAPEVVLTPSASSVSVGEEATYTVTSGLLEDAAGNPVPDGALFTVAATIGTITTSNALPDYPGLQVPVNNQTITFDVTVGTQTGQAVLSAWSHDFTVYGEQTLAYLSAPPVPEVKLDTWDVVYSDPLEVSIVTRPVRDAYGNIVSDGTLLTTVLDGAFWQTVDADGAPGHQVAVQNGVVSVTVETNDPDTAITFDFYADAAQTSPLGTIQITPSQQPSLPLASTGALMVLSAALAGFLLRTKRMTL